MTFHGSPSTLRPSLRPALVALAFALLLLPQAAVGQGDSADPMLDSTTAAAWWNTTRFIDRLALDEALRGQMDALLAAHLEEAEGTERRDAQKKLEDALVAGDWDQARAAVDTVNAARSEAFANQTELKIDVLALLSANQRQALVESFPRLISRPWVRPMRPGAEKGDGPRARR